MQKNLTRKQDHVEALEDLLTGKEDIEQGGKRNSEMEDLCGQP